MNLSIQQSTGCFTRNICCSRICGLRRSQKLCVRGYRTTVPGSINSSSNPISTSPSDQLILEIRPEPSDGTHQLAPCIKTRSQIFRPATPFLLLKISNDFIASGSRQIPRQHLHCGRQRPSCIPMLRQGYQGDQSQVSLSKPKRKWTTGFQSNSPTCQLAL